jgi:predicted PurR-regulated permease PerM
MVALVIIIHVLIMIIITIIIYVLWIQAQDLATLLPEEDSILQAALDALRAQVGSLSSCLHGDASSIHASSFLPSSVRCTRVIFIFA